MRVLDVNRHSTKHPGIAGEIRPSVPLGLQYNQIKISRMQRAYRLQSDSLCTRAHQSWIDDGKTVQIYVGTGSSFPERIYV